MSTVLVTGGTGHLGRDIVRLLKDRGNQVRVLSRHPGDDPDIEWYPGDLGTDAGRERLAAALTGADVVVHAATNSPAAQRGGIRPGDFFRTPRDVDIDGTRALLAGSATAGVRHFLHISIVGVQGSKQPYMKVKAEAENLVRNGGVPWSIVPATVFHWLVGRMFDKMAGNRLWVVPANLDLQPCDTAEFAGYVGEILDAGPAGRCEGFGGPEVLTMAEAARRYQQVRGIQRRIIGLRLPGFLLRAAGRQTVPDGRLGKVTWSDFLAKSGT